MIEFPAGSGIYAEYLAEERPLIRGLPRSEQEFIHLLKHTFDATLVPEGSHPLGWMRG